MRQRRMPLSLFALGLCALVATGQQPTAEKKKDTKPVTPSADTAIEAALANDPDVKMARAKIQLAEAELAKARQVVTQKVLTLQATIRDQKKAVATAEENFKLVNAGHQRGTVAQGDLLLAREKLETVQSALARSETELKLLTGDAKTARMGIPAGQPLDFRDANAAAEWYQAALNLRTTKAEVKGSVADRIRAALDKPVKLGEPRGNVTIAQALDVFRNAGLDVPVHHGLLPDSSIVAQGEELPIGAWLQLFADSWGVVIVVREYGLLMADKKNAPPDAPTVSEFWKQKPVEKETPKR